MTADGRPGSNGTDGRPSGDGAADGGTNDGRAGEDGPRRPERERADGTGGGDRIGRLDPAARERIAAGEVITRPARVVAELLDNALDAGADRIAVAVDGDGTDRIEVRDDGRGMSRADAELAVERHATSKVGTAADLDRVGTLGFRGEALASIAAVARLELVTGDGDGEATRVVVDRDGERRVEPAARGRGTTVAVTDLFHNREPRRASLGTARTEFGRISHLVADYALCRPDVAFRLVHDGSETLSTPGTGPTDAALGVYDRSVAGQSTTLSAEATVGDDPVEVTGLLAYPAVTRATPDHVRVAVNGRPVRDDGLRRAVRRGYGSLLPGDRHPIAAVSLALPAAAVDPNVDPHKRRVGLRDAEGVADAVAAAVRDALSTADLRRAAEVATDLDAALAPADGSSLFDDARVIGQYRDLYVLCEADGDLLVIDGHAAHERVNYERLRAALGDGAVPAAPVDPPATVALSPGGVAVVEERADELDRLGYAAEPFGGDTAKVSAVPAPLGRRAAPETLRDAVDALRAGTGADRRDAVVKDLACHPSLAAGDLSDDDARALVDALGACERPYACPHGRPTVLSVDEATLAKGFEREGVRFDR
ncbi:MAG: DNA mismatch repair endonuclease MutL [Haloferacaceae archaeon]